jgi:NAD(P)-dependent dehydrogenase (short-subunit alcohol dehydrogenase family)
MRMHLFTNKTVLITGGGGGIGRAAAQRFLDQGATVVLSGTRLDRLEAVQRDLDPTGERTLLVAGSITTREQAANLVERAIERFGGVDVLVNSTGIFRPAAFGEQTEDHLEEALGSILRPTYWASQAVVESMRERGGGAIVNVGSMWAVDAIATTPTSAYSAAQAGRHMLTKNLAIELAADGIRVNTVALAFVETPAYERFMTRDEAQACSIPSTASTRSAAAASPTTSRRRSSSSPPTARAGSRAPRSRSTAACSRAAARPCTRCWPRRLPSRRPRRPRSRRRPDLTRRRAASA